MSIENPENIEKNSRVLKSLVSTPLLRALKEHKVEIEVDFESKKESKKIEFDNNITGWKLWLIIVLILLFYLPLVPFILILGISILIIQTVCIIMYNILALFLRAIINSKPIILGTKKIINSIIISDKLKRKEGFIIIYSGLSSKIKWPRPRPLPLSKRLIIIYKITSGWDKIKRNILKIKKIIPKKRSEEPEKTLNSL